ncbi:MAG: ABC transporter ATP-binding protein [Candidatus Cloacimonetes bacterium]|jgi:ATP-binding cassette subfamily B protein/subfamily B ATP-binding cassette protein MsbA|nr:ABC transporter ATP-binding protein [Candidatus Cloacimonadota bacterium]
MMGGGHGRGGGFAEDDLKNRIYDKRLYGKMLRYLMPYLKWVIISFVILMVVAGAELVQPLIQQRAIDDYIVSDKTIAIFTDEARVDAFLDKYKLLKLKKMASEDKFFVVIPSKEMNKINRVDLQELRQKGIIADSKVFLIKDKASNITILNKYIKENKQPQGGGEKLTGWFRVGDKQIALAREELDKIPSTERIQTRAEAAHSLIWLALAFLSISILRFLAGYFQMVITTTFSQKAMNDMRHDVFAHLQRMPVQYFDKNPVGRLVTRVTNDIRAIDEMLSSGVITLFQDVVLIIAIVVLMLVLDWQLALISFAILPLVIWVIREFRKRTRVLYREVRKHLAALNATLAEHIGGQKIIQLFNQYFHKRDEFSRINQEYYLTSLKQMKLFAFFRPIIHVSSQFAVALIIWYGGGQILRNVITIGLLMAFTQYISKLFQPINDFSEKFNILQGALAGAERIFDLMDLEPEDYRGELVSDVKLQGGIEFKNVWLAYNPGEWVLKDVSFKVQPGEKIALVGHTGSGKTSIVNLILGMYPYQKGEILLDDKPLSDYALEDIRKNVGIVQQDVFIFSGNIHDNIALNNHEMSRKQIVQVSKYVNADKFICKLPQGYDEPVMERGATLSTGQRQLIAFARVLAYDPSIFILDEATSNIDTETELLIQDALAKLIQNRSSIIIAHRLSTIQHVDRIIVLHKGKIVEEGSHFELLDHKGLYYDLYRLQYT